MRTKLRSKFALLFLTIAVVLAVPTIAFAQDSTVSTTSPVVPTIQSDKTDYHPGELVTLTGGGWQAGESVHINVNDTYGATWSRNVDVIADASGNITDSFNLPNTFVSDYDVTATGTQSGTATTTFTDSQINAVSVANPTNVSVAQGSTATTYGTVTVDMSGNATQLCDVTLGVSTEPLVNSGPVPGRHPADTGLPTGATPTFTPGSVTNRNNTDWTSALTVATTPTTPTGTYTFHVKATPGDNCQGGTDPVISTNQQLTLVVTSGAQATSTTVTSDNNPSIYGSPVKFTATVTGASSNPSGVGNVTFKDGGTPITGCSAATLSGNTAECTTSSLSASASPHSITATYNGGTGFNASNESSALSQTVNKKALTVNGLSAQDKTYDGNTTAQITGTPTLVGKVGTDDVSLTGTASGTFASKNVNSVGSPQNVTVSGLSLSGTAKDNYTLTQPTLSANITAKTVTGSFSANDKEYDGNASATGTRSLSGVVGTEDVSLSGGTATFNDKNVGTAKTVTLSGANLSGTDAGNYVLASGAITDTADITAKTVTGSFSANDKEYDGNASATGTRSLTGVLGSDNVQLSGGTATFANKNVGTAKTVTLSGANLSGTDAGNYVLASGAITDTADITAKTVTGSFSANDKEYDGNASATGTRSLSGVVGTEDVSLSGGTATFNDKNVGTAKTVTLSGANLSGTDAGNYVLASGAITDTADITAKTVTGSFSANDKEYDGNASATGTRSLTGVLGSDNVQLSGGTATFANKNVGTAKTVTLSGANLSGTDAGNYVLASGAITDTADIIARDLTVSATGQNKEYDGTTTATVNLSTNELSSDTVTANYTSASFANKDVGTGKAVNVSGISISGADAGNYNLTNTNASTTADITKRALTVSATGVNKLYDGNTDVTVTLSDDRVSGDSLNTSYTSASFANKNAGPGKAVSVSGISVTGTDSGNYTFNTTASTTATIAPRPITVSAEAKSKLFGDPDPALTYQVSGGPLVSGESFTGLLSRDPGEAPGQYNITLGTVHVSDGNNGDNYLITYNGAKLTIGAWTFSGFYQPVDMNNTLNTVKGGSTVPIKFELFKGTTELTDTAKVNQPLKAQKVNCTSLASTGEDAIELTATGGTSLRYDTTGGQYIYNWKTPTGAGTCYNVTITANDGSSQTAYFKLK